MTSVILPNIKSFSSSVSEKRTLLLQQLLQHHIVIITDNIIIQWKLAKTCKLQYLLEMEL